MSKPTKLLPRVLAVAAILGGSIAALTFFPDTSPSAATIEPRQASISPRIAAWQDRIAEGKIYAEKAATKDAAEKAADLATFQQFREAHKARGLALRAEPDEGKVRELARERSNRQKAATVQAQRAPQRSLDAAFGYAPEPNRTRFNSIYSAMRETRGGN